MQSWGKIAGAELFCPGLSHPSCPVHAASQGLNGMAYLLSNCRGRLPKGSHAQLEERDQDKLSQSSKGLPGEPVIQLSNCV